jgi:very-short-patch-repair endonuclease
MKAKQTMTAAEYRLEMEKPKKVSESLATARLFAFHINSRRLPAPRWKENGGEVRFAMNEHGIPRQGARKKTDRAPQWAFDFAWPDYRLAVEVEGIIVYRDKASGQMVTRGGHTTPDGFNDDCEKYAWAAVLGWRVLRFTPKQVKAGFAIDMLVRMFAVVDQPQRVEVQRMVFVCDCDPAIGKWCQAHAPARMADLVRTTDELEFKPSPEVLAR